MLLLLVLSDAGNIELENCIEQRLFYRWRLCYTYPKPMIPHRVWVANTCE